MKDEWVDIEVEVTREKANRCLDACLVEMAKGNITAEDVARQYTGGRQTARRLLISTFIAHTLTELAKKYTEQK